MDDRLVDEITSAIESCWQVGSPVVGSTVETWRDLAHVAIRRIRSFDRRNVPADDDAAQIRDIANGLVDRFEDDPKLVGPLFEDYQFVARQSLDAFRRYESKSA